MIPYDVDPSLHAQQPREPQLDDGFSPPTGTNPQPSPSEGSEPSTVTTPPPVDPVLWHKSDF